MVTDEDMQKEYMKQKGKRKLTRARAIRLYCRYNCCANDVTSWRKCEMKYCFLWQYRMGKEISRRDSSLNKAPLKKGSSEPNNDISIPSLKKTIECGSSEIPATTPNISQEVLKV